jgi:thiamine-phosphate pyrophosphorylase
MHAGVDCGIVREQFAHRPPISRTARAIRWTQPLRSAIGRAMTNSRAKAPAPTPKSDAPDGGRIMLVTPPRFDAEALAPKLRAALATGAAGCVRMDMPGASEAEIRRAADILRPICHEADVALILAEHFRLAGPLGLDGVEVESRAVRLRDVRAAIGPDAIMGVACGTSRHDGMTAAEAGADYVLFRPHRVEGALGDGAVADLDLFQWWAEMIETPVVAEGGISEAEMAALAPFADFVIPDADIWDGDVAAKTTALNAILEADD